MRVSDSQLQTVIRVKGHQVKKAQRELADIRVHREVAEGALNDLEEQQSTAMTEAVRRMKTKVADLQTSQAFIQSLGRRIKQQVERVQEIVDREEGKRGELVAREQSKQMIEKIDQKRRDEEEKELARKAQRVIDVLAQRAKSDL
jgi:flagellar export protein FliJ